MKYRDSVTLWTAMIRMMDAFDKKAEARLRSVGWMIYLVADEYEKEAVKEEETEGKKVLEGTDNDANREILVKSIVSLIATETDTEKLQREVEMLSEI